MRKDQRGEDTVTMSKTTMWKVIAGLLGVLMVISIFTDGFNFGKNGGNGAPPSPNAPSLPNAPNPPTVQIKDMKIVADDDPFMGEQKAPVVMVEFSDYQCPFCKRFWSETLPDIKSKYIDTGKVKFVYRDFPLGFHPGAQPAAEAAECARAQGGDTMYFAFHDLIFEGQSKLGQGTPNELKQWAKGVSGLEYAKWENCFDNGKYSAEVRKDLADGSALGISGTPGFIINGKLVSGAQPFAAFQQIIDAELT